MRFVLLTCVVLACDELGLCSLVTAVREKLWKSSSSGRCRESGLASVAVPLEGSNVSPGNLKSAR